MAQSLPDSVATHLRASQEAQKRGDFDAMLQYAEQALVQDGNDWRARFRLFECQLYCGQVDGVVAALETLETQPIDEPRLLCKLAEFYTHCADHDAALRLYRKALLNAPQDPEVLFAISAAEVAVGDLDSAEQRLSDVIRLRPDDYDAYRNRAVLRKQSNDSNHIADIEALLKRGTKTPSGEVQLCYALAKEYEDLGEYSKSFAILQRGAAKRRGLLSYQVSGDIAVMERLRRVFSKSLMGRENDGHDEAGPVFVLGLPRSGTTLVDRILSSHSQVDSLGEVNNFAYSLMHTIGQSADKLALIEKSVRIDFEELGRRYLQSVRAFGKPGPFLIDKTPLNYLYIGLIKLALPAARIVHIHRNPMDSCYGMYRTLFRAGFPFSYDFSDLGAYYVAYRKLMDHWQAVAADGFIDIAYEDLIDDQEGVSRALIEYCELPWEPACLDFHKNTSAVLTASSAQVRRPVYRDALQRWRRYASELQPLVDYLQDNGIEIDAS